MILGNRRTTVLKIGSEAYADFLNDIATAKYYERMLPCEDDPVKEAQAGGHLLWKNETEEDPWERLAAAVIAMCAKDYVQAVLRGSPSVAMECENWFRENEFARPVYEELQRLLAWAGDDEYLQGLVERRIRLIY